MYDLFVGAKHHPGAESGLHILATSMTGTL